MIDLDEKHGGGTRPEDNSAGAPPALGPIHACPVSIPDSNRTREELERRREELVARIRELGGQHHERSPDCPLEVEVAFLERVVAFETTPRTSNRDWLARRGIRFRSPRELGGADLARELSRLVKALATGRVCLANTDHLTDAELYQRLWDMVLPEKVSDSERTRDAEMLWDFSDSPDGSADTWLRWYATEEQRLDWSMEFPDDPMPPRESPPPRRDHRLPKCRSTTGGGR